MKKKIIIDCDPGHDDMMAIMLAIWASDLELTGITTVAGNQTGEKTYINTLKILKMININNIPVARGYDRPLFRKLVTAPEIHGISGLDGAKLPDVEKENKPIHALDFIINTLNNSKEKIWLIPVGPLTNIASVLTKEPSIKEKIERIVLMGGAVFDSNMTPSAEFNILVDPEAADIVFSSGLPITMVGLDVTNKALFSFADIDRLESVKGKISSIIAPLLRFFANANEKIFNLSGAPLHDALAVAQLIDPEILKTKKLNVKIETKGEYTLGRTVTDIYGITKEPPNVDVALDLNLTKFKDLIFSMLEYYDKQAEIYTS